MKAILISIHPGYCEKIIIGQKTVEVRKVKPNLKTPFKCYVYCTKSGSFLRRRFKSNGEPSDIIKLEPRERYSDQTVLNGFVIGEFVCEYVDAVAMNEKMDFLVMLELEEKSCVDLGELKEYANDKYYLYVWHISDFVIYDKPKELVDFNRYSENCCHKMNLHRPPQSWCYVEELKGI